jgi:hypothetical protein
VEDDKIKEIAQTLERHLDEESEVHRSLDAYGEAGGSEDPELMRIEPKKNADKRLTDMMTYRKAYKRTGSSAKSKET